MHLLRLLDRFCKHEVTVRLWDSVVEHGCTQWTREANIKCLKIIIYYLFLSWPAEDNCCAFLIT